ncbi:hypothetical protein [Caldanaerobacter subterraneus]|uniref:Uncharacterized protein n=1 Tax=Caldanaerobacter subterraneus TaxID=911092 RepID=A0A7Y2L600_9THEO|nr:hypothetical protein [Caldanaerobacter subterraneus]NNG66423.1 hypothetical protein [Caldanaerobacter subterraneus]
MKQEILMLNLFEPIEEQIKKFEEKKSKSREENEKETKKEIKINTEEETADVRIVKVYGNEVMVIRDRNIKNEEIRRMLVEQYGYPEFTKEETVFKLIYTNKEKTEAILNVGFNFQKKG